MPLAELVGVLGTSCSAPRARKCVKAEKCAGNSFALPPLAPPVHAERGQVLAQAGSAACSPLAKLGWAGGIWKVLRTVCLVLGRARAGGEPCLLPELCSVAQGRELDPAQPLRL